MENPQRRQAVPISDLPSHLLDFIRTQIPPPSSGDLSLDTSLVVSGLLDSMALVRVAALVERVTGIIIPDQDVTAKHFDTVRLMQEYVIARQSS